MARVLRQYPFLQKPLTGDLFLEKVRAILAAQACRSHQQGAGWPIMPPAVSLTVISPYSDMNLIGRPCGGLDFLLEVLCVGFVA